MFAKKGSVAPAITLIELVVGIMVAVIFISSANMLGDTKQIERFAVSKDVAALLETAQAIPRGIDYEYPETLYQSDIQIEDDTVHINPHSTLQLDGKSLSLTSYGFDTSKFVNVENTVIDGRFFTVYRGEDYISFTQDESIMQKVSKREYEDILISVLIPKGADEDYKLFQSILIGKFQQYFPIEGEATLYVSLLPDSTSKIYYSDHEETKELAKRIQKLMSEVRKIEFTLVPGQRLAPQESFSIEIGLSTTDKNTFKEKSNQVADEVTATIETFYKQ